MKKNIYLLLIFGLMISQQACKKATDSPKKLRNSVVLIQTKFVYKISFNKDLVYYFKETDNEQGIKGGLDGLLSRDNAYANPNMKYGTGFFVSKTGQIATNRHVVEGLTKEVIANVINKLRLQITVTGAKIDQKEREIAEAITGLEYEQQAYGYENSTSIANLQGQLQKVKELKSVMDVVKSATTDSYDIKVESEIIDLGIALNNTHITNQSDFIQCVAVKISEKEEIDLALIQTKDKRTPEKVKTFFKIPKNGKVKVDEGDKILIMGYNQGLTLGNTSEGLKVQQLEGKITQVTDEIKMQYDISTMPGSSGSPVLNEAGKLIAVNFAGLDGSQIKYGIRVKHLVNLMNGLSDEESDSEDE